MWNKLTEKQPPAYLEQAYYVCDKNGAVYIDTWFGFSFGYIDCDEDFISNEDVVYWAEIPLPDPPKEFKR